MITFLTILHVLVCLFLILVVLLQAGKGGGMGIAFGGGGGSQTVFGSSGAGNFLTRLTSITAAIFLVTSLGLAHYSSQQDSKRLQRLAEKKQVEKKVEDERAAKLKQELDQARENASKQTAPPAAGTPVTPVPAVGLTAPSPRAEEKTGEKAEEKTGEKAEKAEKGGAKGARADKAETSGEKTATDKPAKKKISVDGEGASAGGEKAATSKPARPAKKPPSEKAEGEATTPPATAPP
jgi:preprotein translocase subunit SecG